MNSNICRIWWFQKRQHQRCWIYHKVELRITNRKVTPQDNRSSPGQNPSTWLEYFWYFWPTYLWRFLRFLNMRDPQFPLFKTLDDPGVPPILGNRHSCKRHSLAISQQAQFDGRQRCLQRTLRSLNIVGCSTGGSGIQEKGGGINNHKHIF